MKRIYPDNKIFSSIEFQKDKYKFYLISLNLKYDTVMIYSDEDSYIVCRGQEGLPTWIWTKDNIDISKVDEIKNIMDLYLTDRDKDNFTCKKELYDLLVNTGYDKLNNGHYFEMGTLHCKETRKPKECDGYITIPTQDEKPILVKYWYDDSKEMNSTSPISIEQAEEDVQNMIDSKKFYIWKNNEDKIVCMVNYSIVDGQAKLSHVYTPVEERGKGYAANLIYSVTNKLLSEGLVPLLYTDYNYIPSNKAYINAGYIDTGILINFSCSKEKKNIK